ncbi:putative Inner membrane transport protein ydhC [Burkholderiales bacterium 8X]|nr:putative Inner membrane transport protein ydhC [Burkholderiales bacterium 8X]
MTAPCRLAAEAGTPRPPALLYLASVAGLSPLGLNVAVGLQPILAAGEPMDAGGRAAAVAVYALGLGLGQPAAGDAADRWGRRPTILAGLALAGAGALLAACATGGVALLAGRFVTGLGLASCLVVPRASLRDLHQGSALQRSMAILSVVFAIAPAVTPPLAWLLAQLFGWRAPLVLIAWLVGACGIAAWRSHRETRPAATSVPDRASWSLLVRTRSVQRTSLALAGAAAPFFIVAAAGPAALRESTGAGPGLVALLLGGSYLGFALGNQWVRRAAAVPSRIHMAHGLGVVGIGIALLAATLAWPAVWLWGLALTLCAIGHGVVFPAAFSLVLQDLPKQAGLATAAIGTVHMSTGAASAWIAGSLPLSPQVAVVSMAALLVAGGCAAWFLFPLAKDRT